jgi:hypothetical protein
MATALKRYQQTGNTPVFDLQFATGGKRIFATPATREFSRKPGASGYVVTGLSAGWPCADQGKPQTIERTFNDKMSRWVRIPCGSSDSGSITA